LQKLAEGKINPAVTQNGEETGTGVTKSNSKGSYKSNRGGGEKKKGYTANWVKFPTEKIQGPGNKSKPNEKSRGKKRELEDHIWIKRQNGTERQKNQGER